MDQCCSKHFNTSPSMHAALSLPLTFKNAPSCVINSRQLQGAGQKLMQHMRMPWMQCLVWRWTTTLTYYTRNFLRQSEGQNHDGS